MRILIGIDDTDIGGGKLSTARLARMFEPLLPAGVVFAGSVGHHLYRGIRGTTNNKASCIVLEAQGREVLPVLVSLAAAHIEQLAEAESSPGLVVAADVPASLIDFGRVASWQEVETKDALAAMGDLPFQIWRGGRGLVGAAAAVGLTAAGWSGRWMEYGRLRPFDEGIQVSELLGAGIIPVSLENDAEVPAPQDWIDAHEYLRPLLLGQSPVVPLRRITGDRWEVASRKTFQSKKRRNQQ
ncbi:MAG: hypothetical protein P4M01_11750 [Acidobacteriota bacterium]|nr:hypothetical protein [Acidobacteriota bacterium]